MENSKIYVLKLPQVNHATLNKRWSLSSAEDACDDIARDDCPGKLAGVSSSPLSQSAEFPPDTHSVCPLEYDNYIAQCSEEMNMHLLSTASMFSNTESVDPHIRRSSSHPTPLNSECTTRLSELSEHYYNTGETLSQHSLAELWTEQQNRGSQPPCNNPGQPGVFSFTNHNLSGPLAERESPGYLQTTPSSANESEPSEETTSLVHPYGNLLVSNTEREPCDMPRLPTSAQCKPHEGKYEPTERNEHYYDNLPTESHGTPLPTAAKHKPHEDKHEPSEVTTSPKHQYGPTNNLADGEPQGNPLPTAAKHKSLGTKHEGNASLTIATKRKPEDKLEPTEGNASLNHSYYNLVDSPTTKKPLEGKFEPTQGIEHSYYNLNYLPASMLEPAEGTDHSHHGDSVPIASKHKALDDKQESYCDLHTGLEPYYDMHQTTGTLVDREAPVLCNPPPEENIYCNPMTLNMNSKKGTQRGSEYYNLPEVCRNLPVEQEDLSSELQSPSRVEVGRIASAPPRRDKKPMPPFRKRLVGTAPGLLQKSQPWGSSGPSTFFMKATQRETGADITATAKSSPPATPRKFKTTKNEEERKQECPNVNREKIKKELTKVLSVSNLQPPVAQRAYSAPSSPKHNQRSTYNLYLQASKPKRPITKSSSHDEASRKVQWSDAQVAKKPLLLPPKHRKLSGNLSWGGSHTQGNPQSLGQTEGKRYMLGVIRREESTLPATKDASGYESPEYEDIDLQHRGTSPFN